MSTALVKPDRRRNLDSPGTTAGDPADRAGSVDQGFGANRIRIRERGPVADHGPHSDPLIDAETARFDDALFQAPGLRARLLKVQICKIDPVFKEFREGPRQIRFDQSEWGEQGIACNREMANGRF